MRRKCLVVDDGRFVGGIFIHISLVFVFVGNAIKMRVNVEGSNDDIIRGYTHVCHRPRANRMGGWSVRKWETGQGNNVFAVMCLLFINICWCALHIVVYRLISKELLSVAPVEFSPVFMCESIYSCISGPGGSLRVVQKCSRQFVQVESSGNTSGVRGNGIRVCLCGCFCICNKYIIGVWSHIYINSDRG